MIGFLSPLFLAGALAAAIPIVLHLLKREPEARVRFSAVRLLHEAPVEHTSRRRLRELLLLALRVTALLLLALAFARPFFTAGDAASQTGLRVVALDTSFSLDAPGRFDRARQLAREAVSAAPAGSRVAVITFADEAALAAAPTGDRSLALAAVDAARPGFGGTSYRAALNLASETVNAHAPGRESQIVLVTDLQESGWDSGEQAVLPDSAALEVRDAGEPPPNLAVTSVRPAPGRLLVVIRNTGLSGRDARVRLLLDGKPRGETTTTVAGRDSAQVVLPVTGGTAAVVSVDDPAGFQADNVRYALINAASRPAVLVIGGSEDLSRDGFYLQRALAAAGPEGAQFEVQGVTADTLARWQPDQLERFAAVAIVSTRALERRGRELLLAYARNGGGLLLTSGDDMDPAVATETLGGAATIAAAPQQPADAGASRRLAPADPRHPIFRNFGAQLAALALPTFNRLRRLQPGAGCQTIARFTTGEAAILDCGIGNGRALVMASDVNRAWNDFPLHATFVPFVHEAVRYLAGGRSRVDDYLVADVPAGVDPRPGIAVLNAGGQTPRQVSVNVDARESDAARLTVDEFMAAVTRSKQAAGAGTRLEARQQEEQQHVWQYVLFVMLLMMAAESLIAAKAA